MPVVREITGLLWDDANEEHIERRLSTDDIEDFIERGAFFMFQNTRDHPPGRFMLIGTMPTGLLWTVILQESPNGNSDHWRPITAYKSGPHEQRMYEAEVKRLKKKGGRHG